MRIANMHKTKLHHVYLQPQGALEIIFSTGACKEIKINEWMKGIWLSSPYMALALVARAQVISIKLATHAAILIGYIHRITLAKTCTRLSGNCTSWRAKMNKCGKMIQAKGKHCSRASRRRQKKCKRKLPYCFMAPSCTILILACKQPKIFPAYIILYIYIYIYI